MQVVDVIVGGQYGSEAKGHVTAQIVGQAVRDASQEGAPEIEIYNVRVAGPNAGHTAYDQNGEKFAFRSLPVGAVVHDSVKLYIAPGSEIDVEVLIGEIALAESKGHEVQSRLYVSRQATVIEDRHKAQETALVGKIGSTGKGIGAARADRLLRGAVTMGEAFQDGDYPWQWAEPEDLYATDELVHNHSQHVIIEGTQGYGLSLRASGNYPQVTSSDARAVDFLAMAGIDPTRCSVQINNWVVLRVYPIRVAGNSGPMEGETSWSELGLPEERTTVTQKVRRVGAWDEDLARRAIQANGGHNAKVVITMLDQIVPGLEDLDVSGEHSFEGDPRLEAALAWVNEHASYQQLGAHIAGITFSPTKILWTAHAEDNTPAGAEQIAQAVMAELFGEGAEETTDGR